MAEKGVEEQVLAMERLQKNCYPTLYYKHSIEQVGIRSRVTN